MVLMLAEKISPEQLKKISQDLDGYIKFVVDIKREIMTVGGARHVEGEELLLGGGSKREDLWGGGYDLESREMDFDSMTAQEITLNIAVNLGRLARWVGEGKTIRVDQFLTETGEFLKQLETTPKSVRFNKTFLIFKNKFELLRNNKNRNDEWAEEVLTWANILTHRAKLA